MQALRKNKTILFLTNWYPTSSQPLKGIFIKKHVHSILETSYTPVVLHLTYENSTSLYKKNIRKYNDEKGVLTTQIIIHTRFFKLFHLLLFHHKLVLKNISKQIANEYQPALIHSNVLYPAGIWANYLSSMLQIPFVHTEHWSKLDKFLIKSAYRKKGLVSFQNAKFITSVSNYLKNNISKYTEAEKIRIVPNVIDTSKFYFKEKSKANSEIMFSCVAHWNTPKRPDLIINSLNEFSIRQSRKIILNVVGNGPLIEPFKKTKYNIQINFLGDLDAEQLSLLYQTSDYFMHASNIETFSIVIAEALSCGTPVIASNVGAIPELINEENGIVCENSVENWISGLEELIGGKYENKKISVAAGKYSYKKIGEAFEKLYKSVNESD
ncbi:MAG: glycosyltransferase family 4 protein [Bacteroidia bacterium]